MSNTTGLSAKAQAIINGIGTAAAGLGTSLSVIPDGLPSDVKVIAFALGWIILAVSHAAKDFLAGAKEAA